MKNALIHRHINTAIILALLSLAFVKASPKIKPGIPYYQPNPFGNKTKWAKNSDNVAIGNWWKPVTGESSREKSMRDWLRSIHRSKAIAFSLYTHDNGILKITGQCFPLLPKEPKIVSLEIKKNNRWIKIAEEPVIYPGWSVHFKVKNWDNTLNIPFRLRLGDISKFEGLIRRNPSDKEEITVASMSCNSHKDKERFSRTQFISNLKSQDPDLLFFAGDQNYVHDEATFGWLQFGMQFRDLMRDRPTVCIVDDHDVGHPNLWGEAGAV